MEEKYKILIADDEDLVHEYLEEVLSEHELHSAFSLNEEKKKIKSETFDIIIQDIQMKNSLSDGVEELFGGFNLISEFEKKKIIKINYPVVWLMSREKKYNEEFARSTDRDLTNFKHKGNTKKWWEGFAKEILEYMDDIDLQNRYSAKQHYPQVIEVMEKKFKATVDLQTKIVDLINLVENDEWLPIDQFINGYRRIYKLIINNLLDKYKAFSKHYNRNKQLNRFEYLKDILNSTLASLYASLIQATNGAEHRESEQESQNEFGFVFDDEDARQIDNDRFVNYYNKKVFQILCLGLFEFIELADDLLENEEKIEEWNKSAPKDEVITVTITNIKEFGAFAKTIKGEDGLIHVGDFGDKNIEDVLTQGQNINVVNLGMSSNNKGLSFKYLPNLNENTDNVDTDV